jgi:hypothetical protein
VIRQCSSSWQEAGAAWQLACSRSGRQLAERQYLLLPRRHGGIPSGHSTRYECLSLRCFVPCHLATSLCSGVVCTLDSPVFGVKVACVHTAQSPSAAVRRLLMQTGSGACLHSRAGKRWGVVIRLCSVVELEQAGWALGIDYGCNYAPATLPLGFFLVWWCLVDRAACSASVQLEHMSWG